jgi:hypothetical protein
MISLLDMRKRNHFCCFALVALVGLLSFFKAPEEPEKALDRFVSAFKAQDAESIYKMLHPEIVSGKEIRSSDVESFLKRYRSNTLVLEKLTVDSRFKSEDGTTDRFQATAYFRGPVLAPNYSTPSSLTMVLLWVYEDEKWWLERPLSISYVVTSTDSYPTPAQQELGLRFETTLAVLDRLGLPGTEDMALLERPVGGSATEQYRELESLYARERSPQGVDPKGRGVQVLLEAARRSSGGLLQLYQADFQADPTHTRRPVPWDMFQTYVQAAVKYGKSLERREAPHRAESVYRRIMAFGRQFLNEPGGYQFMVWGMTFQKQAAEELCRLLASTGHAQKKEAQGFLNLASRRLDLLQTALGCLDDMTDYRSLQAAIMAAERSGDSVFRPWGINTLTILALKGAPAPADTIKEAGALVLVDNPAMKKVASEELDRLESEPSGRVKSFVENQKQWIVHHEVYGTVKGLR